MVNAEYPCVGWGGGVVCGIVKAKFPMRGCVGIVQASSLWGCVGIVTR